MRVFLEVIEDLYFFATTVLFGWVRFGHKMPAQLSLPVAKTSNANDVSGTPVKLYDTVSSDTRGAWSSDVEGVMQQGALPQRNTIVYCAHARVPLRTTPDTTQDTAIMMLSYGDMVMVLDAKDEWSYVASDGKKGYVPTSALAHHAAQVYPDFEIGKECGPRDTTTVRLRSYIHDEFSANLAGLVLQAHEYVYYKLMRRGIKITWPEIRPRTPGSWAHIFTTVPVAAVGKTPTTGAVMECTYHDGRSHLAYVEQVFPDGSIKISEADWPNRGIYNERMLVAAEWRALSPAFITFG